MPRQRLRTLGTFSLDSVHMAIFQGKEKIVLALIERGAMVNSQDKWLNTPLMYATLHGYTDVVACLVTHGSDVNLINQGVRTALHTAAQSGFSGILRLLLVSGAGNGAVSAAHFILGSFPQPGFEPYTCNVIFGFINRMPLIHNTIPIQV